jgi:hypothetical protein
LYYFGKINNNEIILNNIGKIIKQNWLNISKHFNNIKLDEYIIMPNHMHGIIQILNNYRKNVTKQYQYIHTVGTCHGMSLQNTRQFSNQDFTTASSETKKNYAQLGNTSKIIQKIGIVIGIIFFILTKIYFILRIGKLIFILWKK